MRFTTEIIDFSIGNLDHHILSFQADGTMLHHQFFDSRQDAEAARAFVAGILWQFTQRGIIADGDIPDIRQMMRELPEK
jgi:hypothetical protein